MKNEISRAISSFALNTSRRSSEVAEEGSVLSIKAQRTPYRAARANTPYVCGKSVSNKKRPIQPKKQSLRYSEIPNTNRQQCKPTSYQKYNFGFLSESSEKKSEKTSKSILDFDPSNAVPKPIRKDSIISTKSSISSEANLSNQIHELQHQIEQVKSYVFHVLRPKSVAEVKQPPTEKLMVNLDKMEQYFKASQKIAGDLAFIYKNTLDDIGVLKNGM
jgi:hypothetical protein